MDGAAAARRPQPSKMMIRLTNFTPRMGLILAHDLIATAAAILASFYIRFEDAGLAERWPVLVIMLPAFVVYAGGIFAIFGLFKSKWRFTSLPDLMNIVRAATVLAVSAARARLCAGGAQFLRQLLLRQDHHRALLVLADGFPGGLARRLPLFPLHAHAPPRQGGGNDADAGAWARRRRRGAAARDRKRRREQDPARRNPFARALGPRAGDPRHSGARRAR